MVYNEYTILCHIINFIHLQSVGKSDSGRSFTATTPHNSFITDVELQSPKRSSTSSPTTYDL